jgi:hypothetical protein
VTSGTEDVEVLVVPCDRVSIPLEVPALTFADDATTKSIKENFPVSFEPKLGASRARPNICIVEDTNSLGSYGCHYNRSEEGRGHPIQV